MGYTTLAKFPEKFSGQYIEIHNEEAKRNSYIMLQTIDTVNKSRRLKCGKI